MNTEINRTQKGVQEYYGKTLQSSQDIKTNACCTNQAPPEYIQEALNEIHKEVLNRYYGCGLTIPTDLKNTRVLDLGSGAGHDCYILSKLVGQEGEVIGIDMTDEQLEIATKHLEYHRQKFGYVKSNVEFIKGQIECLDQLGLTDNLFDVIVSNCVINLSTDKEAVLREVFRALKYGGEMYFSDVYTDRRVPTHLSQDQVLYGECLSGALYWNDFERLAKKVGFMDPRVVESIPIELQDKKIIKKVGSIQFHSVTYRLFKLPKLETHCEDYGQAVIYKGTIKESNYLFFLDSHHVFEKGRVHKVCGNTYDMLNLSRYSRHFEFIGNRNTHFGIFEGCGTIAPFEQQNSELSSSSSCC